MYSATINSPLEPAASARMSPLLVDSATRSRGPTANRLTRNDLDDQIHGPRQCNPEATVGVPRPRIDTVELAGDGRVHGRSTRSHGINAEDVVVSLARVPDDIVRESVQRPIRSKNDAERMRDRSRGMTSSYPVPL